MFSYPVLLATVLVGTAVAVAFYRQRRTPSKPPTYDCTLFFTADSVPRYTMRPGLQPKYLYDAMGVWSELNCKNAIWVHVFPGLDSGEADGLTRDLNSVFASGESGAPGKPELIPCGADRCQLLLQHVDESGGSGRLLMEFARVI